MKGKIIVANTRHGRYAAEMDDAECIAFELMDSVELPAGTIFEADLRGHGGETFRTADGENFSVQVEMLGASRATDSAWALA